MVNHIGTSDAGVVDNKIYFKMIGPDKTKLPEQEVRQKLAKDRNWYVCKSWTDWENKKFIYDIALNADQIVRREIEFDEACKSLHWKKFEPVDGGQSLKHTIDPAWLKYIDSLPSHKDE